MRKAQTALEFLATFAAAAMIFIVFSLYISNQFVFFFNATYGSDQAQGISDMIAGQITKAYISGDGFHSVFGLPAGIGRSNFTHVLNTTTGLVEVILDEYPERYGSSRYFADNVVIIGLDAYNIISNSNGTIVVRPMP